MTLLSRSMRSGPREGTTSAVTVRVIFLRVKGKSRNPKTLIGSTFAARSVTAAGGTGLRGTPHRVGWDRNQARDTTGTSVAVSTVISFTGTSSTEPAMRTRRDEKDKEKSMGLCASLELYPTWSELLFFFSGETFPFTPPERMYERRGAGPL